MSTAILERCNETVGRERGQGVKSVTQSGGWLLTSVMSSHICPDDYRALGSVSPLTSDYTSLCYTTDRLLSLIRRRLTTDRLLTVESFIPHQTADALGEREFIQMISERRVRPKLRDNMVSSYRRSMLPSTKLKLIGVTISAVLRLGASCAAAVASSRRRCAGSAARSRRAAPR